MHRSRSKLHVLMTAISLLGLFAACGGRVTGASGGDAGGGGDTGGGGGSGGSGSGGSGGSCVTVPASSLSQSCSTAADCTVVTTGMVCSSSCDCGDTPISNAALAQYEADVASITFDETCPCPSPGVVDCLNGTCTLCDGPGDCTVAIDAGPSSDVGACIDLEPSVFDTSCTTTSDCLDVTLGDLCDSGCLCGGSAINVADQAKYNQLTANVPPGEACGCPYFGKPVCVDGQCIVCGGAAPPNPACADAGP